MCGLFRENKGLNIFNSAYVLADAKTATDTDYERILGVIAHEYFHNWSGNRVTVRDWCVCALACPGVASADDI